MPLNSKPANAIVWSQAGCVHCESAKKLLKTNGVDYIVRVLDGSSMAEFKSMFPKARSVPQIVLDDVYIGGFDALKKVLNNASIA